MSLFALVQGITQGTADYVKAQRDRQRTLEDQDFEFRMRMLENEANRPDFDPRNYERLLGEMMQLSGARTARGTATKGGKSGMLGQQEPLPHGPISQLISGAATGDPSKPFISDRHISTVPAVGMGQQVPSGPMDLTRVAVNGQPAAAPGSGGAGAPGGGSAAPGGAPAAPAAPPATPGAPSRGPVGLTPMPDSALPQPPGGADMLRSANATAQEAQNPVPAAGPVAPRAMSAPPAAGFKPPFDVGPAGQPGGLRFTPQQMDELAANRAATTQYGSQMGATSGKIAALDALVPDDPANPEATHLKEQLKAHLMGLPVRGAQIKWVEKPGDPTRELEMTFDPMTRAETPTGRERTKTTAMSTSTSTTSTVGPSGTTTNTTRSRTAPPAAPAGDTGPATPATLTAPPTASTTPTTPAAPAAPGATPGATPAAASTVAGGGDARVEDYAKQLVARPPKIAPSQIPNIGRTSLKADVLRRAAQLDPTFNAQEAEANFKFSSSSGFQNVTRFMSNISQSLPKLEKASQDLERGGIRIFNRGQLAIQRELNSPAVAVFDTERLLIADEIAKIIAGGGTGNVTSDDKLRQAGKILQGDMDVKSFHATLDTVKDLLKTRRGSFVAGTYLEQPPKGGLYSVQVPGRPKPYNFPTQEAADKFKQEMGIK